MNIYHVERTDNGGGYDTFSDFVCVANSPEEARSIDPESIWEIGPAKPVTEDYDEQSYSAWVKYSKTEATYIGAAAPGLANRKIICASYHAG